MITDLGYNQADDVILLDDELSSEKQLEEQVEEATHAGGG